MVPLQTRDLRPATFFVLFYNIQSQSWNICKTRRIQAAKSIQKIAILFELMFLRWLFVKDLQNKKYKNKLVIWKVFIKS